MKLKSLTMSVATLALIAGMASAQTATGDMTSTGTGMGTAPAADVAPVEPAFTDIRDMTVGDVIGTNVYDPEGSTIGEIDYVVQEAGGASGVIGIGGFLGLGEYTVAIPLSDFELNADGNGFVLATDKETLKQQPEFDESNAESLPDETVVAELIPEEGIESDTDTASTDMQPSADASSDTAAAEVEENSDAASDTAVAEDDSMEPSASDSEMAEEGSGAEEQIGESTAEATDAEESGDPAADATMNADAGTAEESNDDTAQSATDCPEGNVVNDAGECAAPGAASTEETDANN